MGSTIAIRETQQQGESLGCFPLIMGNEEWGGDSTWEPLTFNFLKEIKHAASA